MKKISGNLTLLGDSITSGAMTNYSVIEIGDQVLQKIKVPRGLDNFLTRALSQIGVTTIYLNGKVLLGVTLPDGKTYCYDAKVWKITFVIFILVGLPLIEIIGLGVGAAIFTAVIFIPFYINIFAEIRNYYITTELKSQGAIGIAI